MAGLWADIQQIFTQVKPAVHKQALLKKKVKVGKWAGE